jgi:hypothetical protein
MDAGSMVGKFHVRSGGCDGRLWILARRPVFGSGFAPLSGSESLFFACPRTRWERVRTAKPARRAEGRMPGVKKSNQKKRHPDAALDGPSTRRVREARPGFSTGHPCPVEKDSASLPSPLRALSSEPHRRIGDPRAKSKKPQARFVLAPSALVQRAHQQCAHGCALALPGAPWARRGGGGKARRVAGTDAGQFSVGAGGPVGKPHGLLADSADRSPQSAPSGCPFSWLLLFGQAKRSSSPPGRGAKPPADRPAGRRRTKQKAQLLLKNQPSDER